MNNVSLYGRLETKPELRGLPGRDVCEFWLLARGSRRDTPFTSASSQCASWRSSFTARWGHATGS